MTFTNSKKLVIIDFSGTLSIKTILFSKKGNIRNALHESGMEDLGITVADFWDQIINPTWHEGATSQIDYETLVTNKICAFKNTKKSIIENVVFNFMRLYLNSSFIENQWIPLLRILTENPEIIVIIATDHYSNITNHLIVNMNEVGIKAIPVLEFNANPQEKAILIANSADLKSLKASGEFWFQIKNSLLSIIPKKILVIDDFGSNEHESSEYSDENDVLIRQNDTLREIKSQFQCKVEVYPFILKSIHSEIESTIFSELNQKIQEIKQIIEEKLQ